MAVFSDQVSFLSHCPHTVDMSWGVWVEGVSQLVEG
jgi:hypothetical protein